MIGRFFGGRAADMENSDWRRLDRCSSDPLLPPRIPVIFCGKR
jgi:hypothetical protein